MSYQNTHFFFCSETHMNVSYGLKAYVQAKMQRQVCLWGSLDSQFSLLVEFQVSEKDPVTQ